MKNIISKLAILATAATLSSNAIAGKADKCSHLYVGKVVSFSYQTKIGDFWLGYKMETEYGKGVVVGIGNGVATINVTDARAFPGGHHEFSCSKLF